MTTMTDTERYTTEELESLPTLSESQADDLKVEDEGLRVWLSRTGVADGEPFDNTVTHEELIDGRWVTTLVYNGDDVDEEVPQASAWRITRDGEPVPGEVFTTENEAFARLLRIQPMSVDWAMRHEGWNIEPIL